MLKFIINTLCYFTVIAAFSQKEITKKKEEVKDSIVYKTGYGFRFGIDISKPIITAFNNTYKGLEFVADYRISKKWYIATELGYEDKIIDESVTNSISTGNYIRLGANYNAYKNWLDMNNEIYIGGRYGFSISNQTLNSYTPSTGSYFPSPMITNPSETKDVTAHWAELQVGIKAETLKNLFIGFHASYKIGISINDPVKFKNLYAPGFNTVYASKTGFGFNYTISYLIPFTKK